MLFISVDDFFVKVKDIPRLTKEKEKDLGYQKHHGDTIARDTLIHGYLPFAAAFVRRAPDYIQTLSTVYACIDCLEKSVDQFDFLQNKETFPNYLGKRLRQCITRCICDRY